MTRHRGSGGRRAMSVAAGEPRRAGALAWARLGPVRTGMTVEAVLRLADLPGMERRSPRKNAGTCVIDGGGRTSTS